MRKIILLCAFVVLTIRVAPCLPYNPKETLGTPAGKGTYTEVVPQALSTSGMPSD